MLGSRGAPDDELFAGSAAPDDGTASSIGFGRRVSSMTDKTLRSFDSALRGFVPGGELERRCGCGGDNDREREDLVGLLRSELDAEGIASAHSVAAVSVAKRPVPLPCAPQPALVPMANTSLVTVWGVAVRGLGDEDGARMERGGRMLNIWFSEWVCPYESNGSGTDWSMGSITGSEL